MLDLGKEYLQLVRSAHHRIGVPGLGVRVPRPSNKLKVHGLVARLLERLGEPEGRARLTDEVTSTMHNVDTDVLERGTAVE